MQNVLPLAGTWDPGQHFSSYSFYIWCKYCILVVTRADLRLKWVSGLVLTPEPPRRTRLTPITKQSIPFPLLTFHTPFRALDICPFAAVCFDPERPDIHKPSASTISRTFSVRFLYMQCQTHCRFRNAVGTGEIGTLNGTYQSRSDVALTRGRRAGSSPTLYIPSNNALKCASTTSWI